MVETRLQDFSPGELGQYREEQQKVGQLSQSLHKDGNGKSFR